MGITDAGENLSVLQPVTGQAGNGNVNFNTAGLKSIFIEIVETNGGTITANIQGNVDGAGNTNGNWYNAGYQEVDAQASPARSVSAISVGANTKKVYQVLDQYPNLRVALSSANASPILNIRVYGLPV